MYVLTILSLSLLNGVALAAIAVVARQIAKLQTAAFLRGVIGGVCGIPLEIARVFAAVAIVNFLRPESPDDLTLWLTNFRFQAIPFLVAVGFLAAMAAQAKTQVATVATVSTEPSHETITFRGHTESETVRCSNCSQEIKRLDVGVAEDIPSLQQWRGNVCLHCKKVYCSNCLQLGGPTPCPQCGEPTKPAQRQHLQRFAAIDRKPLPTTPPGPRKSKLPEVGAEFLSSEFAAAEEPAGAGAASFQEAIQASNQKEFDQAQEAFKRAVMEGLPATCESYANCQLGILALRKGRLDRGVDHLLRCLGAEKKSANSAWEAAVRLQVIYTEAGRTKEASALADLAAAANTRGLELERQTEEELRKLLHEPGSQAIPPPAKAA